MSQMKVMVVGTPVCPSVGETSTGFEGGLLIPVPADAVPPEPLTVMVTDGVPATLVGIPNVPLAGPSAVFVAVEDPDEVLRNVAAAGGHASLLMRTRGGWGIVGNREQMQGAPAMRLLMGPVLR